MTFFTRTNRPVTIPSPVGDGTAPIYEKRVVDGKAVLVETGRDNLFEFVQASKDECNIYNILARFQRGDVDVLNRRQGQYLDVVGLPTNMAEMHQMLINVESTFKSLDPEIRKKFNNSVDVFIEQVAHSTPEAIQEIFGISAPNVEVKDGDGDVA